MAWTIKLSKEAQTEIAKLDKPVREKIIAFLDRIPLYPSPRSIGKALKGQWSGRWRYSVGDYRLSLPMPKGKGFARSLILSLHLLIQASLFLRAWPVRPYCIAPKGTQHYFF